MTTQSLTQALLAAHRSGTPVDPASVSEQPTDMAAAYDVQEAVLAELGESRAWKVGPWVEGKAPACAPIPTAWIYGDGVSLPAPPIGGLEVEFALLPQGDPLDPDTVVEVALVYELVASRLSNPKSWPEPTRFADFQSSAGIILGVARDMPETGDKTIELSFESGADPVIVHTSFDREALLKALRWMAEEAARRGRPIRKGDVVITGARIGPIPVPSGKATASCTGFSPIAVTFGG
ncbi:MAG: hypothetical protein ACO1OK_02445 [Devosia sp.]